MMKSFLFWSRCLLILIFGGGGISTAATRAPLDLVSMEAAFCLEVPDLDRNWTTVESGQLWSRLRPFPAFQRLFETRGFQQWQAVEDHVARQTGQTLSSQLRALVGRSLVVAVYVPPQGNPQGILIGEAIDPSAIEMALLTWSKLEANQVASTKTHHGIRYQELKKHPRAAESIFVVTSGALFAISDHEALIQQVIDRFASDDEATASSFARDSIAGTPAFVRNRQRLTTTGAAYVHLSARPWDRGMEESSRGDADAINVAKIWKHVAAVSASLQVDGGLVCDVIIALDSGHLPDGWSQFVAAAATNPLWTGRVPADAMLAISGHFDAGPLIRFLLGQVAPHDAAELAKNRRIAQSLLGGHDLFDVVFPALAHGFGGFVVARTDDNTQRATLDGALIFTMAPTDATKLLQNVDHGLETGLRVLAAYFSAEGRDLVTMQREQQGATLYRWLSTSARFPVAYGLKGDSLVIAGSRGRLNQTITSLETSVENPRLIEHATRFFPRANQLVWLDIAQTRETLAKSGSDLAHLFVQDSTEESRRASKRLEQLRPALELMDSLFVAGKIEADHVHVIIGGGLDAK
jgi:hypothetical protein